MAKTNADKKLELEAALGRISLSATAMQDEKAAWVKRWNVLQEQGEQIAAEIKELKGNG